MDVDDVPATTVPAPVSETATAATATAEGTDDLDLDQLASYYQGRTKATRLLSIASSYPPFALHALTLALAIVPAATLDVPLYEQAYAQYRTHLNALLTGELKDPQALAWYEANARGREVQLDRAWIERTRKAAKSGLDKLEVELKGYTTNLIKESIRMGHRDLARFQYSIGDLPGAIRSYTKSREFCTTSQHVLEMCLGVLSVALEMANYSFLRNYIIKAESALEAINSTSSATAAGKAKLVAPSNMPGMLAPALDPLEVAKEREKVIVQERLNVVNGVAQLGLGNYNLAARALVNAGRETMNSSQEHFIPPADIALYATLTGLATFSRTELKTLLLENGDLRAMFDLEPYLRDLLRAFYASDFKEGLGLLDRHHVRFYLDPHLRPHLDSLLSLITSRALLAYFAPFSTVSLARFAAAFGWDPLRLRHHIVVLIQSGEMKARIDSIAGVLVARKQEGREEAFRRALAGGEEIERRTVASQLRMKLIKSDVVVKGPKLHNQAKEVF